MHARMIVCCVAGPVQHTARHTAQRALDNDVLCVWCAWRPRSVDGRVGGTYGFHTNRDRYPWVAIDLGAPHAVSEIVVRNRADGHFDDSLPLELLLAAPGGDFEPVARRTERFTASRPWRVALDGRVADRLRLQVPRRTFLALGEIEVYGKQP